MPQWHGVTFSCIMFPNSGRPYRVLFLCRVFALPPALITPPCITSYSAEEAGDGHGHVGLAFLTELPFFGASVSAGGSSFSGSSAFPAVVSFASNLRSVRLVLYPVWQRPSVGTGICPVSKQPLGRFDTEFPGYLESNLTQAGVW